MPGNAKKEAVINNPTTTSTTTTTTRPAPRPTSSPAGKAPTIKIVESIRTGPGAGNRKVVGARTRPANQAAPNPGAVAIARAISSPHDTFPIRIHDAYSNAATAIARPYTIQPITWNPMGAANPTNCNLPLTDMVLFLFRDYLRAAIYYDPNPTPSTYLYTAMFASSSGVTTGVSTLPLSSETDLPVVYWNSANTYSPHGPKLYTGRSQGNNIKYTWIEKNSTATWNTGNPTVAADYILVTKLNDGVPGVPSKVAASVSMTNTIAAGNFPASGYYSFRVFCTTTNSITGLSFTSNGSVMCHLPMPGLSAMLPSVQAAKAYAGSMMLTDEASELNAQGKVAIYQASQGQEFTDYVPFSSTTSLFSQVATSNTAHIERLADGVYGFLKPTAAKDFDMVTFTEIDLGDTLNDAWFELSPRNAFLVIYAQATAAGAGDCYATFSWHVEFETDNVFIDTAPPSGNARAHEQGMEMIARLPQFSCNPLHLSDIWGAIRNGGNRALQAYQNAPVEEILKGVNNTYKSTLPIAKALQKMLKM